MIVLLHPDLDPGVGLGHLSRSIALAQAVRSLGSSSIFLIADQPPARARLAESGFPFEVSDPPFGGTDDALAVAERAHRLEAQAVVVDGYTVDADYLTAIRAATRALMLLDDFGRFDLPADLILNIGAQPRNDDPRLLAGLQYALLQEPYWKVIVRVRPEVERVLVTFGSMDAHGLTLLSARVISSLPGDFALDVIVGPFFDDLRDLRQLAAESDRPIALHEAPPSLFPHIQRADLAVTAGGVSLLEIAACGVPAITVETFVNQRSNLSALASAGAVTALSLAAVLAHPQTLAEAVAAAWPRIQRERMSAQARQVVDGQGARRAAEALLARVAALE